MLTTGTVFSRPENSAAKCLHFMRQNPVMTRAELVDSTGLSQPTVTRAVSALLEVGLLRERKDLTQSQGRGRPIVPLEMGDNDWMLAGLAVGTTSTYVALYDNRGRIIAEDDVSTPVAKLSAENFIEHLLAGVNRLAAGNDRQLVSVGVTTSGTVSPEGLVHAPNLGWEDMDIAARLHYQFRVPVTVSAAVPAILGSEIQATGFHDVSKVLLLFADDSLGAALANAGEVRTIALPHINGQVPENTLVTSAIQEKLSTAGDDGAILSYRARTLGHIAAELTQTHQPDTVVIAGGAFYEQADAPQAFAAEFRSRLRASQLEIPKLRLIPSHQEIVRSIARAVALDPLLRTPLELKKK